MTPPHGPLDGLRILELASIGPGAHAAMILADLGADVLRVQRPGELTADTDSRNQLHRGRRVVEANLKSTNGIEQILDLTERADVLIEGYRPGVTERLGIGPTVVRDRNPALVYARVTGWGQDGPRAHKAGHDINFLAPTGILHSMGRADDRPIPPLNIIAGFGGGSMFLVAGILSALWERKTSGQGQVIDVSMAEGAALLAQHAWSMRADGGWSDARGENLVDGSCPFWDTYECSDGNFMAVGAFEPQFYADLLDVLDLDPNVLPAQSDRARWPELRKSIAAQFRTRSRAQWTAEFEDLDACVTPVLSFAEAPDDPHFVARESFAKIDGVIQPLPTPRFSRTPPRQPTPPSTEAVNARDIWQSHSE
ncbi:UNVERIFIED_ORG: alpha-methylacyl-CoA racemase [Nocardia globerula]|uniref:Alpha-methylacyl-CoA racemase n=1 Tax=Nocardia globerula TaxID=1818 RepID=A0A652YTB7_NOCGL|nr:CaiB/BaiF CoA-transferase family protein [Rhodococcus globerulus]PVX67125.1 alpha-methylacyl-CoA racemase [Rhodococcus globerulus]